MTDDWESLAAAWAELNSSRAEEESTLDLIREFGVEYLKYRNALSDLKGVSVGQAHDLVVHCLLNPARGVQ